VLLTKISLFNPSRFPQQPELPRVTGGTAPQPCLGNQQRLQENMPRASHTTSGICKSKLPLLQENLITSWSFWDTAQVNIGGMEGTQLFLFETFLSFPRY